MGFTSGFTGGVTLTLGLAYLTVLSHQRHRQSQCDALRANTSVLRALAHADPIAAAQLGSSPEAIALSDPYAAPPPYDYETSSFSLASSSSSFSPSSYDRPSFVDELKDRWNAQLISAARGVQNTDWAAVGQDAQATVARLWHQAAGSAVAESVRADAQSIQAGVAGAVTSAQNQASEVVQAAVQSAAQSAPAASAASAAQKSDKQLTDVERALQQRYAKLDESVMKKKVGDLLDERYKPAKQ